MEKKTKIYLVGITITMLLFLIRVIVAFEHYSLAGIFVLFIGVVFVSHFIFMISILIIQWQRKIYTKYWLRYQIGGQYFTFILFTAIALMIYVGKLPLKSDGYVFMISSVMLLVGAFFERTIEEEKIRTHQQNQEDIVDEYEKNLYK